MSNIFCSSVHKYSIERDTLEWRVKAILFNEDCNDITCIKLRILRGYNKDISKNDPN